MITLNATLLKNIEYFSDLTDDQIKEILSSKDNGIVEYQPKDCIFRENEVGEHLFIMLEGQAEVYVKGEHGSQRDICIANLKPGAHFGDNSVRSDAVMRRSATVKVVLPSKVFKIHKKYVLGAIKENPISISSYSASLSASPALEMLKKIPVFHGLTPEQMENTSPWLQVVNVKKGQVIFNPGEKAEFLYVVISGKVEILVIAPNGTKQKMSEHTSGQYFGEIELLPGGNGKHYQLAIAADNSTIAKVSKSIFDNLLKKNAMLVNYIKQMNQFKKINITHTIK